MQEKEAPTTLEEATDIAKALEPLGYAVYGVEDTWYSGKIQGLVVKVIRVPQGAEDGKHEAARKGRRVKG
jgi:hypothetical protein